MATTYETVLYVQSLQNEDGDIEDRIAEVNCTEELCDLVNTVFSDDNVRYCPHGRPVMVRYTKKEIEKLFGRIV